MRVLLDANVLFSAAYVDRGHAQRLLDIARTGDCTLLASAYALGEARNNLSAKASHALPRLEGLVPPLEIVLDPPDGLVTLAAAEGLPAKDAPILAAAIAARPSTRSPMPPAGAPRRTSMPRGVGRRG